jgi:hypothetical protein
MDENLDTEIDYFKTFVVGGKTPSEAERILSKWWGAERAKLVHAEYVRRNQRFIILKDPRVLRESPEIETWYPGPDHEGAWCWPAYKALVGARGWDPEDLKSLNDSSTKVMAHLEHPGRTFATRGLVVGYVQSGKTANYAALIAKAADVGYRLFIVLAGTTSSLRRQTQERLDEDLFTTHRENWTALTSTRLDFGAMPGNPDALLHPAHPRSRVVCVVKKNVRILERLRKFLGAASGTTLAQCPALIIDDEADNASVNTKAGADATAINGLIKANLELLPKAAYVAYTATPFANIFIDPTAPADLFPRDFIADLPRPNAYFGSEKIFGREVLNHDDDDLAFDGLPLIRTISVAKPDEPSMLRPGTRAEKDDFEVTLPESLQNSICYFLMATACRYARGQSGEHSSMLVHTTPYVVLHGRTQKVIEEHVRYLGKAVKNGKKKAFSELWAKEMDFTAHLAEGRTVDFDAMFAQLPLALERCRVVVDNGLLASQLIYPKKDDPKVFIAVGGNTLSRGLTLEGLVVSYFIRVAGAYDTLLQMGRWFGYRRKYEDLPRLWMTDELESYFFFLAGVEEELRHDIRRLEMERKKPSDLQIRVRTHAFLQITSKLKMRSAQVVSASYSDSRLQTTFFEEKNKDRLAGNIKEARKLIAAIKPRPATAGLKKGSRVFRDVPAETIESFLTGYAFHERHADFKLDLLLGYIRSERAAGSLKKWNVGILGRSEVDGSLGTIDLGLDEPIACINRSRYQTMEPCNVKALTSPIDRIIDLDKPPDDVDDEKMVELRNEKALGVGLLLLYPISKNSAPIRSKPEWKKATCRACHEDHWCPDAGVATRHPLHAAEHVIGVALVFPKSIVGDTAYMANSLIVSDEGDVDEDVLQAMAGEEDQ